MSDLREKQLRTENVFDGVLLHVYRDKVALPNGHHTVREYIKHPGAAVMIPITDDGQIIFERQFRYPLDMELIELPAGKIDPGEDALDSAKRELEEETGYVGETFIDLGLLHPCIGYSDEVIYIYLVKNLTFVEEQQDKDEFIETFEMSLGEALDAVRSGQITDAKTIISLFRAEKYLTGEWEESEASIYHNDE